MLYRLLKLWRGDIQRSKCNQLNGVGCRQLQYFPIMPVAVPPPHVCALLKWSPCPPSSKKSMVRAAGVRGSLQMFSCEALIFCDIGGQAKFQNTLLGPILQSSTLAELSYNITVSNWPPRYLATSQSVKIPILKVLQQASSKVKMTSFFW